MKRKILLLICLILFIVSIAGVSAADDVNQTVNDDTLGVSLSDVEIVGSADNGTFTDLQKKIDDAGDGATIELENDYAYKSSAITINKTITINGKGYTIDAMGYDRIFIISADNVVLKNITFINGYGRGTNGGAIYSSGALNICDCSFEDCRARAAYEEDSVYGGAIYSSGALNVVGSSFNNCYITPYGSGGGIYCDGILSVDSSMFTNCRYGAISSNENASIKNTIFQDNSPYDFYPSNIHIENTTISSHIVIGIDKSVYYSSEDIEIDITLDDGATGEVIVSINGVEESLTLTDSSASLIKSNLAYGAYDVVVNYLGDDTFSPSTKSNRFKVVGGSFKDLQERIDSDYDGVIDLDKDYGYIEDQDGASPIQINKSITINGNGHTIDGNNAMSIFNINSSSVVLNDINFNDVADNRYGAIVSNGVLNISGSNFTNCHSDWKNGGAISSSGILNIDDCSFVDCSASRLGGAVYSSGNLSVSGSSFADCSVDFDDGGAVYSSGALNLVNCSFADCSARQLGGAVYSSGNLSVSGSSFVDCIGAYSGGAVYSSGNLSVSDSSFVNSSGYGRGGAVYSSGNLSVSGCSFVNSTVTAYEAYGGAICSDGALNVDDCTFINNSAYGSGQFSQVAYGGAIYSSESVNVANSKFISNVVYSLKFSYGSGGYGGAIYSSGNFTNCSFLNNSADGGAAIFGYHLNISDSTFLNNKAKYKIVLNGFYVYSNDLYCEEYGGYLEISFYGFNTDINAIYSYSSYDKPIFNNVTYWGVDGIMNTDNSSSYGKGGINISISINNSGVVKEIIMCTDNNGHISYYLGDDAGNYTISVYHPDDSYYVESGTKIINATLRSASHINLTSEESVVKANVTPGATGDVTFIVKWPDGGYVKVKTVDLVDSVAEFDLSDLESGQYSVYAYYNGDDNYRRSSTDIIINISSTGYHINASDVTKYYGGSEQFIATLTDGDNNPISNATINVTIDGLTTFKVTDIQGQVAVDLNQPSGNYTVSTSYGNLTTTSNILIKPTISADDVVGDYNNVKYTVNLLDSAGKALTNGSVTFTMGSKKYTATISDGKATLDVSENHGSYIIEAVNPVTGETISNNVTVNPVSTKITLSGVKDINVGDALAVTANVNSTAGVVTFKVGSVSKSVDVVGGKASYTISGLSSGSYDVNVTYSDALGNYLDSSDSKSFKVSKVNPALDVVAEDIFEGQDAVFEITVNGDATGNVTVNVNSNVYAGILSGGKATVNVPGLTENVTALITYPGDDKYNNASTSVDIVVYPAPVIPKENLTLVASANPISVGQVVIIVVDGFENATGNASARVGDGVYFASVGGGSAVFRISGLVANDTALITYPGDDKYNNASTSVDIIVNPVNTNITLSFTVNGNNVTLTADVSPSDLTGEVIFAVNGENYTAQIADCKATYTLANLESGSYVANAAYKGNATHKPSQSNDVSFNISEDYVVITAPEWKSIIMGLNGLQLL